MTLTFSFLNLNPLGLCGLLGLKIQKLNNVGYSAD